MAPTGRGLVHVPARVVTPEDGILCAITSHLAQKDFPVWGGGVQYLSIHVALGLAQDTSIVLGPVSVADWACLPVISDFYTPLTPPSTNRDSWCWKTHPQLKCKKSWCIYTNFFGVFFNFEFLKEICCNILKIIFPCFALYLHQKFYCAFKYISKFNSLKRAISHI